MGQHVHAALLPVDAQGDETLDGARCGGRLGGGRRRAKEIAGRRGRGPRGDDALDEGASGERALLGVHDEFRIRHRTVPSCGENVGPL